MLGNTLQFRPRLWSSVTVVLACAIFVKLGLWQMARAESRQALAEVVGQRPLLATVELTESTPFEEALLYRRAVVRGSFEPAGRILLDGRKQDGRLGYHLIVPLRISGGDLRVLVNRGWIPREEAQRAVAAPSAGDTEVRGLITRPALPAIRLGGASGADWGERWPYLDVEHFAALRNYPVGPLVLIEDARLVSETLAALGNGEEKWGMHMGYAIQWFAFALLAVGLYALHSVRRPGSTEAERGR